MPARMPLTNATMAAALPLLANLGAADDAPILLSATGSPSVVQAQADAFRGLLGPLNPNLGTSFEGGRRETHCDAVPDGRPGLKAEAGQGRTLDIKGAACPEGNIGRIEAAPAAVSRPGGARGADPLHAGIWETSAGGRRDGAAGATMELALFAPGDGSAASTRGFGAVFANLGPDDTLSLTFFDARNTPLGIFFAPAAPFPGCLSFFGVYFGANLISRVRIAGLATPGTAGASVTDLIFGEPAPGELKGAPSMHQAHRSGPGLPDRGIVAGAWSSSSLG